MNRTYFKGIALVAVLALLLTSTILVQAAPLGQDEGNVYEVIQGNENLSTLAEAIAAAGLAETLAGEGPFTIFAPDNAAFEAIPAEELEALLADPAMLSDILLLHVVPGELLAADLAGQSPATALGDPLEIAGEGEDVTVNGASVVAADLVAANGVVHVIDSVLGAPAAESDTEGDEAATDEATEETAADEATDEATDEAATDAAAEDGSDAEAAPADEAAEPAADAAVADSEDATAEASDESAAPAMAPADDNGSQGETNIAELSGRPRSQYMKVWRGIYQPRTLGR